jgi:hypothetical protein
MCHSSLRTEWEEKDHVAEKHGRQALDDFLKYVSTLEWKSDSFSIGRNNFDLPEPDRRGLWDDGVTVNSPDLDMIKSLTGQTVHWFAALKSLHLPITSKPTPNSRSLPNDFSYTGVLAFTAFSLEDLSLSTDWYKREPWALPLQKSPYSIFDILRPCNFKKLKSFELRGWRFSLEEIETFLFAQADTLRYIHVIDCQLHEHYGGAYALALQRISQTWPKHLNLRRAEVIGLRFPAATPSTSAFDNMQPAPHKHNCDQYVEDAPNPNVYPRPEQEQHPVSQCPGPRPEFEKAMLGGRYNNVVRRSPRQFAGMKYSGDQWEDKPVHPYG